MRVAGDFMICAPLSTPRLPAALVQCPAGPAARWLAEPSCRGGLCFGQGMTPRACTSSTNSDFSNVFSGTRSSKGRLVHPETPLWASTCALNAAFRRLAGFEAPAPPVYSPLPPLDSSPPPRLGPAPHPEPRAVLLITVPGSSPVEGPCGSSRQG